MQKTLSNKEVKALLPVFARYGMTLSRKDTVMVREGQPTIYLVNTEPVCFLSEGRPVPTLSAVLSGKATLPSATVDAGAIPFVVKGADIMRPGIVACEPFGKDDAVVVREVTHHKPLAIGIALLGSEALMAEQKGKAIRTLHWIGDPLWQAFP